MDVMIRRRMMMVEVGEPTPPTPLPYDAEVEYLENGGTQFIDTGIIANDTDVINCECMFLSKSGDNFVFGSGSQSTTGGLWAEIYNNKTWYVRFGSSTSANTNTGAGINALKVLVLKKNYFSVNGTRRLQPNYTSMPQITIKLFANNTNYTASHVRIYSFSVENGQGNKIIDFIPVRVGQVGYMYDRVSSQLYGNDGTGDFILGNDKNT